MALVVCDRAETWDAFMSQASDSSLLQSWAWGELKARYGWEVRRYLWVQNGAARCGASVLRRPLPGGFAIHYTPHGPVLNGHFEEWPALWDALRPVLTAEGSIMLKLDPEWDTGQAGVLRAVGARPNPHPINHRATYQVDISGGEAAFRRLKESTRRNIRIGERNGLCVDISAESSAIPAFYQLLKETSDRAGYIRRPTSYYENVLRLFHERDQCAIYIARDGATPVAAAMMMFYGPKMIYLFGGTSFARKDLKPGYTLHWRAIEDAQRRGCTIYDMWGVPPRVTRTHPGYGYSEFKSRFNGRRVEFVGLHDLNIRKPLALALRGLEEVRERFARVKRAEHI